VADKALGVGDECPNEGFLARGVHGIGLDVMDLIGGQEAGPGVMVVLVVPVEELAPEGLGIRTAAE